MNTIPRNRSQMAVLLQEAIDNHQPPGPPGPPSEPPLTDEEVALVATGRLDELSPADQDRVLRQIAGDGESAQVLKEVYYALGLGRRDKAPPATWTFAASLPFVRVALTAAACMVVVMGLWRLADPPAPISQAPDGSFRIMSHGGPGSAQPDYWAQLDQQRLAQRAQRDHLRDYALIASTTTCLILAVPIVWLAIHPRPRKKSED